MNFKIRGSDVWLKTDLENIMQALALTADESPGEYARGYRAALAAMAVAIGATIPPYVPDKAPFRT